MPIIKTYAIQIVQNPIFHKLKLLRILFHFCMVVDKCSLTPSFEINLNSFEFSHRTKHRRTNVARIPISSHSILDLMIWRPIRLIMKGRPFNMHNRRGSTQKYVAMIWTLKWSMRGTSIWIYCGPIHSNYRSIQSFVN